jgi:hypothetical protein
MSIVSFDVSCSEAEVTLVVEAHGSVYYPEEFVDPITQVDAFYMTWVHHLNKNLEPEELPWVETDELWLINHLGKEVFTILITNIEDSLMEEFLSEEGKEITNEYISTRNN